MIRLLALVAFSISLPAFGAANLAKPAKAKTTTTTTSASKKSPGKSSLAVSEVRPPARGYKLVPMLGVAAFTLENFKFGDATVRADEGVAVGLMADYKLKNTDWTLQGGVSFFQMGARVRGTTQFGTPFTIIGKNDYLGFTTAAKYYLPVNIFYGKAGIVTLINTRADYEAKGPGVSEKGKFHNIRDMDFLAQLGGGFEFVVDKNYSMGGELTFNRGLLDVTTSGNRTVYNQGFMLSGFMSL